VVMIVVGAGMIQFIIFTVKTRLENLEFRLRRECIV